MALRLCAGCNRHVRTSESACPFCGDTTAAPLPSPVSRATRAAMVFGATVLVAGASAACSDSATTTDAGTTTDAAVDAQGPVAAYGGPPVDASAFDSALPDTGPVAAYGAPPVDAGTD